MAKRKRLSLATPPDSLPPAAGAMLADPDRSEATSRLRAPIAQVAGDAAAQAALGELADEVRAARTGGRLVQALPLEAVVEDHLVRDRMLQDEQETEILKASLVARGQQTPIQVVELEDGRFGLISGWRRLAALRALQVETGEARFDVVQALIKPIETIADSYVAMVEENEIRANLSFYERAHLACAAAELGVYPTPQRAVQALFANAAPAKRSKILSFVKLHDALGEMLRFPAAIPEKLGLALAKVIEEDAMLTDRMKSRLRESPARSAEDERAVLERAIRATPTKQEVGEEVTPGVILSAKGGRVVLRGKGVSETLVEELRCWLAAR